MFDDIVVNIEECKDSIHLYMNELMVSFQCHEQRMN